MVLHAVLELFSAKNFQTLNMLQIFYVKSFAIFFIGWFICLMVDSCQPSRNLGKNTLEFFAYKTVIPDFNFGDPQQFDISIKEMTTDGNNRILVFYAKTKLKDKRNTESFLRISEDGGKTFGAEYPFMPEKQFESFSFRFVKSGIAVIAKQKGNIFYSHSGASLENWHEFTQINDEQDSYYAAADLQQANEQDIYCIWTDKRRGFDLVFFSSSHDGGKNWSLNQPVEYDFREGRQSYPRLVIGAKERLLVFWEDWRDRRSLVDVRFSYSDDRGETWIPSEKINDDDQEVWQMAPSIVAKEGNIYAVFSDFREEGEENDNDWNIYFTRSKNNGATWEKNKRLNLIKEGRDTNPILFIDKIGNIYCIWRTTKENLFGQLSFSYSHDGGENWSPPKYLTGKDEMTQDSAVFGRSVLPGKILFGWIKEKYEQKERIYSFLEETSDTLDFKDVNISAKPDEVSEFFTDETGETLFLDDFSAETAEKWQPDSGFWSVENKTYMGVLPNKTSGVFISYADFAEPGSYILQGKFRLDAAAHSSANIYFRSNKTGSHHYVITNFFELVPG